MLEGEEEVCSSGRVVGGCWPAMLMLIFGEIRRADCNVTDIMLFVLFRDSERFFCAAKSAGAGRKSCHMTDLVSK